MIKRKEHILNSLRKPGIVPVFYHDDPAYACEVMLACYEAGARSFEFTNRGRQATGVFAELIAQATKNCRDMSVGIGSITEAYTAAIFLNTGAEFIVSPIFNPDIAMLCNRHKTLWIPGCGTLTEMNNAEAYGAEIVKLFPGQQYGPGFVKAIKGPSPRTEVMPTGGIDLQKETMKEWFDAGISCFGIGSSLFGKKDEKKSPELIKSELADAIAFLRSVIHT
ncbi:MAG: bifunctional 4-hydroxy-2-oxoglutarate aldolase/2-dehydro-3-deoxy-phosphogluconate aldolase [Cyclobacteriaceae bacterium]